MRSGTTKLERVRAYWRRRVAKLEAQLLAERTAHHITQHAKLIEVHANPMVPKDTIYMWARGASDER